MTAVAATEAAVKWPPLSCPCLPKIYRGGSVPVLELRARIFPPHCFSKVVFTLFKIGISSTLESSEQKTCLTTFQL